jgi:hypothetical protein
MSDSLMKFVKSELRAAGLFDADADYDGAIATTVVALVETFSAYGHSGGSAEQTLAVFDKLVRRIPLTPLTGEDDEWEERRDDEPFWRNTRCPTVCKDLVTAWDSARGDKTITFPYAVE